MAFQGYSYPGLTVIGAVSPSVQELAKVFNTSALMAMQEPVPEDLAWAEVALPESHRPHQPALQQLPPELRAVQPRQLRAVSLGHGDAPCAEPSARDSRPPGDRHPRAEPHGGALPSGGARDLLAPDRDR